MAERPSKKPRLLFESDSLREGDSPEFHQGRSRTTPHIEGVWPAHIFLELKPTSALRKALKASVALASQSIPPDKIHSFLDQLPLEGKSDPASTSEPPPLHLSFSKPLSIQASERQSFRSHIAAIAKKFAAFEASFASFAVLENDELTRRFLGVEIGYGYSQMKELTDAIDERLVSLRLPPYYESPRFHSSIAWSSITSTSSIQPSEPPIELPFDEIALEKMEKKFGDRVRDEVLWVGEIGVSIGKEVWRYKLTSA